MIGLIKKIILCAFLSAVLWLAGLGWFVSQIPAKPMLFPPSADAIIALTGGELRVEYGLQLLATGKGKALFISGVGKGVTANEILNKSKIHFLTKPDIVLGSDAENTIGNAQESAQWIKNTPYKSILLVTSNYHMPRSISEFEELMPDIYIVPTPVFPNNFNLAHWASDPTSRELLLSEYHKYLAGKLRHWVVSAINPS